MAKSSAVPPPRGALLKALLSLPRFRTFRPASLPPGPEWARLAVRRIRRHFRNPVIAPPATPHAIRRLRAAIPDRPPELDALLSVCDGVDALASGRRLMDVDGVLYGVDEMASGRKQFVDFWGPGYVPLRGDGCGDLDCLVVAAGPCRGAVVFCDHDWMGPSYLLASDLWHYLDMWSDMLVHSFGRDGTRIEPVDYSVQREGGGSPTMDTALIMGLAAAAFSDRRIARRLEHPWPLDRAWMKRRDPDAAALLDSPVVEDWFRTHGR